MFKLAGYEIRTKQHAFTVESQNFSQNSNEYKVSHAGYNFLFKLNLDKNLIKNQCRQLIGENNETNFELLVIDLDGNILKQFFRF